MHARQQADEAPAAIIFFVYYYQRARQELYAAYILASVATLLPRYAHNVER